MGYLPYACGYQRLAASGVVSDSGKPILIAGFSILSGATAAVPYFNNGTAASNALAFRPGPVTVSTGNTVSLPMPVSFPGGCYVSFDANTTEVTVFYILNA
jgi:hypothetical protein